MARFVFVLVISVIVWRIVWRIASAFMQGLRGGADAPRTRETNQDAVPMARDPVCGTFVVPERAVMLSDGRSRVYFCSDTCRDRYRARTA